MAEQHNQIQVEKFSLLHASLDDSLQRAFSDYEAINLQYGASWLSNLASHALDPHDSAVLYVARLSTDNFVALPLKMDSRSHQASSLSTFYTSAYSPVINSDTPEALLLALFQHLANVERVSAINLFPMDYSSPVFKLVHDAIEQAQWKGVHEFFCFGNWIHEIGTETFHSYLSSRPPNMRNTIARKTRKFLADDRGRLEIIHGGGDLESGIAQFVSVYNNSWKLEEPYTEFVPQLMRLAARRGWLRLGIASYDNLAIASQIWLVYAGTAYIFKLAYHEDYKSLSPGTILTTYMMERVIEDDAVARIDYLSGDDAYKRDWMSRRREQFGIAAYNPRTVRGLAMLCARTLNQSLKKIRRQTRAGAN